MLWNVGEFIHEAFGTKDKRKLGFWNDQIGVGERKWKVEAMGCAGQAGSERTYICSNNAFFVDSHRAPKLYIYNYTTSASGRDGSALMLPKMKFDHILKHKNPGRIPLAPPYTVPRGARGAAFFVALGRRRR